MRVSMETLFLVLLCAVIFLIFLTWLNYSSIQGIWESIGYMQETDEMVIEWMKLKDGMLML